MTLTLKQAAAVDDVRGFAYSWQSNRPTYTRLPACGSDAGPGEVHYVCGSSATIQVAPSDAPRATLRVWAVNAAASLSPEPATLTWNTTLPDQDAMYASAHQWSTDLGGHVPAAECPSGTSSVRCLADNNVTDSGQYPIAIPAGVGYGAEPLSSTVTYVAGAAAENQGGHTVALTVPAGVTTDHFGVVTVATAKSGGLRGATLPGWTIRDDQDRPAGESTSSSYVFTRLGGQQAGDELTATLPDSVGATMTAAWYDTGGRDVQAVGPLWDTGADDLSTVRWPAPSYTGTADVLLVAASRKAGAPTTPQPPLGSNVAGLATATASSENPADGQTAAKAIDGVIDGYPGDYRAEWATQSGGAGSWLQLGWTSPVELTRLVLHDRPNENEQVTGATIAFSDGSTVDVPALDNAGGATVVDFPARSTTLVRITLTSVSAFTSNAGLSEVQAWTTPGSAVPSSPVVTDPVPQGAVGSNVAGLAAATASSENPADGQTAVKVIDGVIDGFPGDYRAEWATQGGGAGSWLELTWNSPVELSRLVLHDRPNENDQVTAATIAFSNGTTVVVPALDNAGAPRVVDFPARSTTSVRITVTSVSASTANAGLSEVQAWTTPGDTGASIDHQQFVTTQWNGGGIFGHAEDVAPTTFSATWSGGAVSHDVNALQLVLADPAAGVAGALNFGPESTTPMISEPGVVVDTTKSFTVGAWLTPTASTGYQTAVSERGSRNSGFFLQLDPQMRWVFAMAPTDQAGSPIRATAASAASTGQTVYVAGVYDAGNRELRLYVNGTLAATERLSPPAGPAADQGLTLGSAWLDGKVVDRWNGQIANPAVVQAPLTATQIFNLQAGAFFPGLD